MVLLDTHVAVWLVLEPNKLSKKTVATIEQVRKANSGIASVKSMTTCDLTPNSPCFFDLRSLGHEM